MKNTKPYQLLNALKSHEFSLLRKFIDSSYFNNKEEIKKLLEYYLELLKNDETIKTSRENAFKYIFPKAEFELEKIRRITSELTILIQKFLVNQELRYNQTLEKKLLIQSLGKRNLSKMFVDESKKLINQLKKFKVQDIHSLLDSYTVSQDLYFFPTKIDDNKNMSYLVDAQEKLDTFYLLSKLKLSCEAVGRKNTYSNTFEIPLFNEILLLSEEWENRNELFNLYLLVLKNIRNKNDGNALEDLKNHFLKNVNQLSKKEGHALFLLILNINSNLINYGKSDAIKVQLNLYKQGLKHDVLINNNIITPESFTNIIVLGIQQKEYQWTENFIKSHSKFLSKTVYEQCYTFSKGYLAYGKGDYEEAIRHLWNCKFNELAFDIRTKSILIRAVVEQFFEVPDKFEFCLGQIQTIEKFIRRRKDLVSNKSKAYLNFIKFTKKIVVLKRNKKLNRIEIEKLKNKILKEPYSIGKAWLNEKLSIQLLLLQEQD